MAVLLCPLAGYRVFGLVTTTRDRQRHVHRDAPGAEALHHSPQLGQFVWRSRESTAFPKRVASAVEADRPG